MTAGGDQDRRVARQARRIAVVIAATMIAWIAAQALGGRLGLPARLALVFDLAALAAFGWALVGTYQLWRLRQDNRG